MTQLYNFHSDVGKIICHLHNVHTKTQVIMGKFLFICGSAISHVNIAHKSCYKGLAWPQCRIKIILQQINQLSCREDQQISLLNTWTKLNKDEGFDKIRNSSCDTFQTCEWIPLGVRGTSTRNRAPLPCWIMARI